MSFWGYKFETLCLLPNPWASTPRDFIENRENEIVNNHAQYCSVVRTGIGKNVIIIGGEVDAGEWIFTPMFKTREADQLMLGGVLVWIAARTCF